jgi:hypothetical protein
VPAAGFVIVIVEAVSYVEVEVLVDVVVIVVVLGEICKKEEQKESASLIACNALTTMSTARHSRFEVA